MKLKYILASLLIFNSILIFADYSFTAYTVTAGLSNNSVFDVFQDSYGYIWIATADGLNKFDGINFITFRHDYKNPNSLPDNWITSVTEDRDRNVWVATEGAGVSRYNRNENKFYNYSSVPDDENTISDNQCWKVYCDQSGDIWISTYNGGLNKYIPREDNFVRYVNRTDDDTSISANNVWPIVQDKDGDIWVGTEGDGVSRYSKSANRFYNYRNISDNKNSISGNIVWAILRDSSDNMWFGANYRGLNKYNIESDSFVRYDLPDEIKNERIYSICEVEKNVLLIGVTTGLLEFNCITGIYNRIKNPQYNEKNEDNRIRTIIKDKSGVIWAGGMDGVSKLTLKLFKYHAKKNNENLYGSNYEVLSLAETGSGKILVSTGRGVDEFNPKTGQFTQIALNKRFAVRKVYAAVEDQHGRIWFALSSGLFCKELDGEIIDYGNKLKLKQIIVNCILSDRNGFVLVGTEQNGLIRIGGLSETVEYFGIDENGQNTLFSRGITELTMDKSGDVWIGTGGNGLYRFSLEAGIIRKYSSEANELSSNIIQSVHSNRDGAIWVGTQNAGLNRIDSVTGKTKIFDQPELYYSTIKNSIKSLVESDDGMLWIATTYGVAKIRKSDLTSRIFTKSDGINEVEFNSRAVLYHSNGKIYFGTRNGIVEIDPSLVGETSYQPLVVITAFRIFDREYNSDKNLEILDKVRLTYRDNFFSFEFLALDHANIENNSYKYMLEGFDKEWIYTGNRRYASYTNLEGGRYRLHIAGTNRDGVWSSNIKTIDITVKPPFWKTIYAFIVYGVIAIFIFILLVRWSLYRYSKRMKKNDESLIQERFIIERERLRIGQDLHDDIGQELTGIALFAKSLEEDISEEDKDLKLKAKSIVDYLNRVIDKIRNLARGLATIEIKHGEFYKVLCELTREIMNRNRVNIVVDIDETIIIDNDTVVKHLYHIIQESISNGIKHGHAQNFIISLARKKGYEVLRIENDGHSIVKTSDENLGMGIKTIKYRTNLIGGSVRVYSENDRTIVECQFKERTLMRFED